MGRRRSSDDYSRTLVFGRALTPVLPTVVLVSLNHVIMLALAQLGIRNNYSNNLSLSDRQGSSNEPKAGWPGEPSHEVVWLAWGSRSGATRLTESSLSGPQGPSIYTFTGGGGAIHGHRLCMRESWITQVHGVALTVLLTVSTNPIYFQGFPPTMLVVGGKQDGKTSLTWISVTSSPRLSQMPSFRFKHE